MYRLAQPVCIVFLFLVCNSLLYAQQHMNHYYDGSGLLSGITYNGMFDRDHYLWVCTDRGLSRFDGSTFRHFTVEDGLADNDVTYVLQDNTGTIWAEPFQREVSFLEPGKTLFRNINTIIHPDTVRRDQAYMVYPMPDSSIVLVANSGSSVRIVKDGRLTGSVYLAPGLRRWSGTVFRNSNGSLVFFGKRTIKLLHPSGDSLVLRQPYSFYRSEQKGHFLWLLDSAKRTLTCIDISRGATGTFVRRLTLPEPVHRFGFWHDDMLMVNMQSGRLIAIDPSSGRFVQDAIRTYIAFAACNALHQVKVLFTRSDGIYTFTQIDTGYYRDLQGTPSFMHRKGIEIKVLDEHGQWMYPAVTGAKLLPQHTPDVPRFTETVNGRTWVYANTLLELRQGVLLHFKDSCSSVKDVYRLNDSIRYVAAGHGALVLNCSSGQWRRIYRGRCTSIAPGAGSLVFIGTLTGLLCRGINVTGYDGWETVNFPLIRITDMAYTCGILWVATAGKGLYALQNRRIVKVLQKADGLLDNAIESIAADSAGHLVIGYAMGAQRLTFHLQHNKLLFPELLTLDTHNDGIKYLDYAGGKVYGIGNRGMLILPEKLQEPVWQFRIRIDRVMVDGHVTELDPAYTLPAGTHDFFISFSTVNYHRLPVRYRYRNNGGSWTYTTGPSLRLYNLTSGEYRIELQVLQNYGRPSDIHVLTIRVLQPFYLRAGFLLLAGAVLLLLLVLTIRLWYRLKYRKARQLLAKDSQMKELELAALKAQINPHFVFNCLNTVKSLIYRQQLEEADHYMDRFSYLFRSTLEMSAVPLHPVALEIAYIQTYLGLEQVSVNGRFAFRTEVQPHMDTQTTGIPPMLLQPYVENAVKHGVSRLKDRKGMIVITFALQDGQLVCTVTDNGVGRAASRTGPAKHKEQGMPISARRAELYNIQVHVTDNSPSGTIVQLTIPLKTIDTYDQSIYS